ncbi:hypothetical protein N9545_04755 [Salibacteraceae bacterium]|nr:hypothetical protein [Salibacteraceae bacterium]MDB9708866.1 hypothetical protein [Salibacteraceae bacterium]MDC1304656.1 hypothetical protein [Salibacteraceae bacterium]
MSENSERSVLEKELFFPLAEKYSPLHSEQTEHYKKSQTQYHLDQMKSKKTLQKLTDLKIAKIISLEQITPDDLEELSKSEKGQLMQTLTDQFRELSGTERDDFYTKIEPIIGTVSKNQLWESNHIAITAAISNLMQDYGRMPSTTELAIETKLSRQTIHKHLKEYTLHPHYLKEIERFRFMTSKVLAKVFQFAVNGDIGAAKLYFNMVGASNNGQIQNNTLIQNQNNFIQINGTVLSQDSIKQLEPEQLNYLEQILKSTIANEPKKE